MRGSVWKMCYHKTHFVLHIRIMKAGVEHDDSKADNVASICICK